MKFSDPEFFLLFLPFCIVGFPVFGRFGRRSAIGFLVLMSLAFYAQWSRIYLLLLVVSIVLNFLVARLISRYTLRERLQTAVLICGIAANLGVLIYFKYLFPMLNFFAAVGPSHHGWSPIVLPLGISFYTFTQISYLVDLKQGVATPEDFLSYTLFVTFFPHLIAGPIVHHREMMPQFRPDRSYRLDSEDLALGLTWFTLGLAKKVLIADRIAPVADALFAQPRTGALEAWVAVLTYSMQLYFDFSGYSDMAVGLARIFSIRFPLNFNSPYKATSILEFWQRWHMTLTRYIMDYVYGPLQLSVSRRRLRQGKKVTRRAVATPQGFAQMVALPTLVTMLVAGVWHGAGLRFLVFGLLHAMYLVVNHAWRLFVPGESRLRKPFVAPVNVGCTYLAVVCAEIFFRAPSLRSASAVLASMMGRYRVPPAEQPLPLLTLLSLLALLAIVWTMPNSQELLGEREKDHAPNWTLLPRLRWHPTFRWWFATATSFSLCTMYASATSTFLYFQF